MFLFVKCFAVFLKYFLTFPRCVPDMRTTYRSASRKDVIFVMAYRHGHCGLDPQSSSPKSARDFGSKAGMTPETRTCPLMHRISG